MVENKAQRDGYLVIPYLDLDLRTYSIEDHATALRSLMFHKARGNGTPPAVDAPLDPVAVGRLRHLVTQLAPEEYRGVLVLIDLVSQSLRPELKPDAWENAVRDILDPRLLLIPELKFKLFLPKPLIPSLMNYRTVGLDAALVHPFCVRWNEERLRRLMERRIETVSGSGDGSLWMINTDSYLGGFRGLDDEVIDQALSMPGAPRNLNWLIHRMILIKAKSPLVLENFRLTVADLLEARDLLLKLMDRLAHDSRAIPSVLTRTQVRHLETLYCEQKRRYAELSRHIAELDKDYSREADGVRRLTLKDRRQEHVNEREDVANEMVKIETMLGDSEIDCREMLADVSL